MNEHYPPLGIEKKVGALLRKIDGMQRAGKFSELDDIMRNWDVKSYSTEETLALLTFTKASKNFTSYRPIFVKKCRLHYNEIYPIKKADALMSGLE
jgi:hypothetical protein